MLSSQDKTLMATAAQGHWGLLAARAGEVSSQIRLTDPELPTHVMDRQIARLDEAPHCLLTDIKK
jgi:hypothetical protein